MANMYKTIPDDALETHKLGSIYYLLSGLTTINTILRHTLLPKSGDHRMIRGHSINLLHMFDVPEKFKVMTLIVETIKRTTTDQKRSCGFPLIFRFLSTPRVQTRTFCWIMIIFHFGQSLRTTPSLWILHILLQPQLMLVQRLQGLQHLVLPQLHYSRSIKCNISFKLLGGSSGVWPTSHRTRRVLRGL